MLPNGHSESDRHPRGRAVEQMRARRRHHLPAHRPHDAVGPAGRRGLPYWSAARDRCFPCTRVLRLTLLRPGASAVRVVGWLFVALYAAAYMSTSLLFVA